MGRINQGSELLDALGPEMRDALGHPWRREILRVLHTSRRPRSIGELAIALPPISAARISYHLQALRRNGVVSTGGASAVEGRHHVYRSLVAADAQALAVLRGRERSDQGQRKALASRKSSLVLKAFHVPQPGRSIRLGAHRNRPEPKA